MNYIGNSLAQTKKNRNSGVWWKWETHNIQLCDPASSSVVKKVGDLFTLQEHTGDVRNRRVTTKSI